MSLDEQVVGAVFTVSGPVAFPPSGVRLVSEVADPRHVPLGPQRFSAAAEKRAAPEVVPSELAKELVQIVRLLRKNHRLVRVRASDDRGLDETGVDLAQLRILR